MRTSLTRVRAARKAMPPTLRGSSPAAPGSECTVLSSCGTSIASVPAAPAGPGADFRLNSLKRLKVAIEPLWSWECSEESCRSGGEQRLVQAGDAADAPWAPPAAAPADRLHQPTAQPLHCRWHTRSYTATQRHTAMHRLQQQQCGLILAAVLLAAACIAPQRADAARLLLLPLASESHIAAFTALSTALEQHGHEIVMVRRAVTAHALEQHHHPAPPPPRPTPPAPPRP